MFQESFDLSQVTADNVDTILHEQFTRFHPSLPTGILIHNTPIFLGLSRVIKKFGLSQIQFEALFQIIMNKKLAIRRKIILVSLLLPRENVPEECVIRVIASIRNSNVKLTKRLLQWIISIYDMVDSTDGQFKNTYPILFHYLTIDAIRTEICHLLYFMTRKERVTKYRIRKLKEMIDKERDNSALIALLMVYKSYDHSIEVPHNIRLKDTIIFEHPDPECRNNLINIKRLWTNTEDELDLHRPIISFSSSTSNNNKARKRSKKNKTESPLTTRTVDIQYRNLDVQEVLHSAENINQLQFNEQLDTMLGDRMLQHVIVCNPDDSLILRIGYWLDQKLLYLLRWPNPKDPGKNEFKELLKKLIKLTQFTK
ncbi:hypothetical protein G6F35_010086 [Rhizopus arrhizus]|nr:hypothetical protein G6F35_010086 [Rhizopus arrhizus]